MTKGENAEAAIVATVGVMRPLLVLLCLCLATVGCREDPAASETDDVRIASMSPAVTSYVLAMGGGDRLVAVSNYEADPAVADLPKVGDYLTVDWEKLAAAEPTVLFVQAAPGRLPEGLRSRAEALGIDVRRVELDVLADAVIVMEELKPLMPDVTEAQAALDAWRGGIAAIADEAESDQPVPAVIVTHLGNGIAVAGRGTYLDEMLTQAGGTNAATVDGYATLDAEALAATGATVVLVLAPGEPKTDIEPVQAALPGARVTVLKGDDVLLPGYNTLDLTRQMFDALHGATP